jgi:hypothetical protein
MMPLLQHRRTDLRDLPPDLIGEHDQAIFLERGRVALELGNCRHRPVRNQLQHQMLLVAEAEVRRRQARRGERKERLRSERPSLRPTCGGLLLGASTRPICRSPARTLASRGAGPRRGSSFGLQTVRAQGCASLVRRWMRESAVPRPRGSRIPHTGESWLQLTRLAVRARSHARSRATTHVAVAPAKPDGANGAATLRRRIIPRAASQEATSTSSNEPRQSPRDAPSEVPGYSLGRDRVEPRLLHARFDPLALCIGDPSVDFRKHAE